MNGAMKGVVDIYQIVLPPKQGTSQLISGRTDLYVYYFYPYFFSSQITEAAPLPPPPRPPPPPPPTHTHTQKKLIIRGDPAAAEASCENN